MTTSLGRGIARATVLLGLLAWPAQAQETAPAPLEMAQVEAMLQRLEANTGLDETLRTRAQELLRQTISALRFAETQAAKAKDFAEATASAPARIAELNALVEAKPQPMPVTFSADDPLETLEPLLAQGQAELAAAEQQLASLQASLDARAGRWRDLPELIAAAKGRLAEIEATSAVEGEDPESQARRLFDQARRQAATEELRALETELQGFDVRGELRTLERDLAQRALNQWTSVVQGLETLVARKREVRARESAVRAADAVQSLLANPHLSPALRERVQLTQSRVEDLLKRRNGPDGLMRSIEKTDRMLSETAAKLADLRSNFERARKRVEVAGLNNAVGVLLRNYRGSLSDTTNLGWQMRARQNTYDDVELTLIDLEESRSSLPPLETLLDQLLSTLPPEIEDPERDAIAANLRELMRRGRELLDSFIQEYETYLEKLADLDQSETQLIALTKEFRNYIDERVLWIRSAPPLGPADVPAVVQELLEDSNPALWMAQVRIMLADLRNALGWYILAGTSFLVLLCLAPGLRRRRIVESEAAASRSNTSIAPTFRTLLYCILRALPLPLLLLFLGWRLLQAGAGDDFTRALGTGVLRGGILLAGLLFVHQIMARNSLAREHLNWPDGVAQRLYNRTLLLVYVLVPLVIFNGLQLSFTSDAARNSLPRLSFIAVMLVTVWFGHSVFAPAKRTVMMWYSDASRGHVERVAWLVYGFAVGMPTFLIVLALVGYVYTAEQLSTRLLETFLLLGFLLLTREIVFRWLRIERRRVAIQQAREHREALKASQGEEGGDVPGVVPERLDIQRIDVQTQRIVRTALFLCLIGGLFFVWSRELPAVNVLNTVELWTTTVDEIVESTGTDGVAEYSTETRRVPVTLWHLFVAIAAAAITFAGARNVPGLLEFTLLRQFTLQPGERNAISSLVTYLIAGIGASYVLGTLGFSWDRIQWLVAALGVGLGFGLQEIVANFTAGLVLLFEQPIRVGDTVTVGNVSGTVTKIRIRATTIVDWDRKELIVPNKEFISGQLINWTLSDTTLRIIVPVGVAYGSDTTKVVEILDRIAREHPKVLAEPKHLVLFVGFGESTLNFELRVYIPDISVNLSTKHDLHMMIDQAFREAGIEIAFPQRDLHIRSVPDVIRIRQDVDPDPEAPRGNDQPERSS